MKFSEQWLRTWVNPQVSREELVARLSMVGLEVDAVVPVAGEYQRELRMHAPPDHQQTHRTDAPRVLSDRPPGRRRPARSAGPGRARCRREERRAGASRSRPGRWRSEAPRPPR